MKTKCIMIVLLSTFSIQSEARYLSYYPDAGSSYILNWVSNTQTLRNSNYPSFSSDCTNFASQGLWAGGWSNTVIGSDKSDVYWYFLSKSQYSQTWTVANALYRHFANGYEGWYGGSYSQTNLQANYGDIMFADWTGDGIIDHTMYVTGFSRRSDGSLEPRLSYHSVDRKDIKWSDFYNIAINNSPYNPPKFYKFSYYSYPVSPPSNRIY